MEDVHMETPPMSSTSYLESPSAVQETGNTGEDPSRLSAIRASLGQSTVRDFGIYRDILEEHHERRERIIKVSRDINNFSKKMIFALHRAEPKDYLPQFSALSEALMEFKEKHATVLKLFHRAAIDLQGSNYYRYQRSISGAMQEYIEAMTLEYYLVHGKLMPKSALETDLVFMTSPEQFSDPDLIIGIGQTQSGGGGGGGGGGGSRGKFNKDNRKTPYSKDKREGGRKPGNTATTDATPVDSLISANNTTTPMVIEDIHASTATTSTAAQAGVQEVKLTKLTLEVTDEDYLLGIADLTGELMRLAINTLGQSLVVSTKDLELEGGLQLPSPEERVQQILSFLRNIKSGFDGLSLTRSSPISKKMGVLKQSLNKIEMACYNVKVRGAEYPPDILRQMLMSGQDVGGGSNGGTGGEAGDDDEE